MDEKMAVVLTRQQHAVLSGLVKRTLSENIRVGSTGLWVDTIEELADILNPDPNSEVTARLKINPIGDEPFGTKVTFWSDSWGNCHALIIDSPKPDHERKNLDSNAYKIVKRSGGIMDVHAIMLTLGWHPEAVD